MRRASTSSATWRSATSRRAARGWKDLEALDELGRVGAPVGLDDADDDIAAGLGLDVGVLQHAVGLADSGRHPEVDRVMTSLQAVVHGLMLPARCGSAGPAA